jgi:hypothetical protein
MVGAATTSAVLARRRIVPAGPISRVGDSAEKFD